MGRWTSTWVLEQLPLRVSNDEYTQWLSSAVGELGQLKVDE